MVQIIEENPSPSLGSRFAGAFANLGQQGARAFSDIAIQRQQNRKMSENQAEEDRRILEETGLNLSGIRDPKTREQIIGAQLKNQSNKKDISGTFGQILDEMEGLKSAVGYNLEAINPWSETSGKRSKINTLRLSLEGLFRDLTLKGQFPKAIYERILKELPSSTDTEVQYQNKIDAIRSILESHAQHQGNGHEKEKSIHMVDSQGNEYDIPANMYDKAIKKGFKKR